ncbi:hypothetical protein TKK_0015138 [Trichogramma kaykai]|uniref:Ribonuclease P protein subunit p20 n=1 Tax=Trichogramma kaykai TaxID=54128 RepID=A0ABD2WAF8_9HYME
MERRVKKQTSVNHIVKKRTPRQLAKTKNDIYVDNKTNFKAFLKFCEKIFNSGSREVIIHGLGKSIPRACELALRLQSIHHNTLQIDTKTSTVKLVDDWEPTNDDADFEVNERTNSAIRIRLYRLIAVGPGKFDS